MAFLTPLVDTTAPPDGAHGQRRRLHHALTDLRRGLPCVVAGSGLTLAAVAAETVEAAGLAELRALAGAATPWLLLAPGRAAALVEVADDPGEVVALSVGPALLEPTVLQALADPTAAQPPGHPALTSVAAPPGAGACLALAKLAHLLPAMLVAGLPDGAPTGTAVVLDASDVLLARSAPADGLVRVAEAAVPLADAADSRVVAFRGAADGMEHLALLIGAPETAESPLVRIHSECFTGDLLGSLRCDCGPQLHGAIRRMASEGNGVLLYLAQEGRGIGLVNKLRAYALQDRGMDTLDANHALGWGADERDYAVAAAMLRLLGVTRVRLLTNNPRKVASLARGDIAVERVSHLFASNGVNDRYLAAKVARFGHLPE